jgi:hypothetical protein
VFRIAVFSVFLLASLAAAPLRSPAASPDQIQAMFDAGKFRQVLRETAIVVHLRDPAKFGYDLHAIWLLKAEAHLRLKQQILSAEAFESASKVAPDSASSDLDHATGLAVGESKAGVYISVAEREDVRAKGTSVVDPAGRAKSLEALFEDRFAAAKHSLDPLDKEKSVKKIVGASDTLAELRRIERAATATSTTAGNSDRTDAIANKLAARADRLIGDPLVAESNQVEQIARNAAQIVTVQVNVPDPNNPKKTQPQQQQAKQGLSSADLQFLTQVEGDCRRTIAECTDAASLLQADPQIFATTNSAATFLLARATTIATAP